MYASMPHVCFDCLCSMHVCEQMCVHTSVHVCLCVRVCMYKFTHTHTYMHTYIYTHIHIYTHIYKHTLNTSVLKQSFICRYSYTYIHNISRAQAAKMIFLSPEHHFRSLKLHLQAFIHTHTYIHAYMIHNIFTSRASFSIIKASFLALRAASELPLDTCAM